jgi:hypothetical protein
MRGRDRRAVSPIRRSAQVVADANRVQKRGGPKNVRRGTSFAFTRFGDASIAPKTPHGSWRNGRGWVRTSDLSRVNGIGFVALLTAAAAQRFMVPSIERVEADLAGEEADLLAEIRDISRRLQQVEQRLSRTRGGTP